MLPVHSGKISEFSTYFNFTWNIFGHEDIEIVMVVDNNKNEETFWKKVSETLPYKHKVHLMDVDEKFNGIRGHDLQQFYMINADLYVSSKYIGFVDSDTIWTGFINYKSLFFDLQPVMVGQIYYTNSNFWGSVSKNTHSVFKHPEVMKCMSIFPHIIQSDHLKGMAMLLLFFHFGGGHKIKIVNIRQWKFKRALRLHVLAFLTSKSANTKKVSSHYQFFSENLGQVSWICVLRQNKYWNSKFWIFQKSRFSVSQPH